MNVKMIPVTSSQIESIGHDYELNRLFVQVHNRRVGGEGPSYRYDNVNDQLFVEVSDADSMGWCFIQRIKSQPDVYPCRRVD